MIESVNEDTVQASPRLWDRVLWIMTGIALIVTLILTDAVFRSYSFWQGEHAAIYWLSYSHSVVIPTLISATITGFLLPFVMLNQMRLWHRGTLSLLVAVVVFVVYATLLGPALVWYQHRDSLHLNGHTYYLATQEERFSWSFSPPTMAYLFKCDALGLICHRIYFSEPTDAYPMTLSADPASGEIQLLGINGEVLTTVTPDP